MRNSVAINRRGLTPVIAITARGASPEFAARLANAVAAAHIALQLSVKSQSIRKAQALVDAQLDAVRAQLDIEEDAENRVLAEIVGNLAAGGNRPELLTLTAALAQSEEPHLATLLRQELLASVMASGLASDLDARLTGLQ